MCALHRDLENYYTVFENYYSKITTRFRKLLHDSIIQYLLVALGEVSEVCGLHRAHVRPHLWDLGDLVTGVHRWRYCTTHSVRPHLGG